MTANDSNDPFPTATALALGANLETAFFEIFDGKTPAMWLKHSYPSLMLG